MLKEIIISFLEDGNHNFTMRPVNYKWANKVFLALIIPGEEADLTIECHHINDSRIKLHKMRSLWTINGVNSIQKSINNYTFFNLADTKEYSDLKKYIDDTCSGNKVIVEFEHNQYIDYVVADVVGIIPR
jgi:hypothetical protein